MLPLIPIISALTSIVPEIAGWIGGDKAEEAATDIADIAKSITGIDDAQEATDAVLADPSLVLQFKQDVLAQKNELDRIYLADRQGAREMYQNSDHDMSDKIADRATTWNVPFIMLMAVINCFAVYFFRENVALVAIVSNVIGMVIQSLINQLSQIYGFFYGSMKTAKPKEK